MILFIMYVCIIMCIYMCVYAHMYIHIHMHTYIHAHTHVCTYACRHEYIHLCVLYIQSHIYIYIYKQTYTDPIPSMYICTVLMHLCMYVFDLYWFLSAGILTLSSGVQAAGTGGGRVFSLCMGSLCLGMLDTHLVNSTFAEL